jgi:hypothetical protein
LYTEVHTVRFDRYPNTNLLIRNLPNKINVLKSSKTREGGGVGGGEREKKKEEKLRQKTYFPPLFTAEFSESSAAPDPLQNSLFL